MQLFHTYSIKIIYLIRNDLNCAHLSNKSLLIVAYGGIYLTLYGCQDIDLSLNTSWQNKYSGDTTLLFLLRLKTLGVPAVFLRDPGAPRFNVMLFIILGDYFSYRQHQHLCLCGLISVIVLFCICFIPHMGHRVSWTDHIVHNQTNLPSVLPDLLYPHVQKWDWIILIFDLNGIILGNLCTCARNLNIICHRSNLEERESRDFAEVFFLCLAAYSLLFKLFCDNCLSTEED